MPALFKQGFSVREPMWHGLGVVLPDYPGREEAMRLAGHTFDVLERPLWVGRPVTPDFAPSLNSRGAPIVDVGFSDHDGLYTPERTAGGWKAIVREDNGRLLSVVRDTYEVLQWSTLWDIVDTIVDQPNVRYETAGLLKDGAVGWVLTWLDEPTTIPGDDSPVYPFISASTTHDGSGACRAIATDVRIVCWNTYSYAHGRAEAEGAQFVFRHRGDVQTRIAEARGLLRGVRAAHSGFVELATELASRRVSDEGVKRFVAEFIPEPIKPTDRTLANAQERRAAVMSILSGGTGTINDGIRNTGWALLQAGTEYLDHFRGYRTGETYFARSVLKQEPLKPRLTKLVRDVVEEYAIA